MLHKTKLVVFISHLDSHIFYTHYLQFMDNYGRSKGKRDHELLYHLPSFYTRKILLVNDMANTGK
jgi:hypothetical protein